ncbi:MAG: hypothetical protein GF329_08295 [Candidatus Lokiarchaeota archaeon]|nr:hypothetical protein [Candidatus Lokiarchaeota archaeon]
MERDLTGCGECSDFYSPRNLSCEKRRRLVRRYKAKYNIDLNKNTKQFIKHGAEKWMGLERIKYSCKKCGELKVPIPIYAIIVTINNKNKNELSIGLSRKPKYSFKYKLSKFQLTYLINFITS